MRLGALNPEIELGDQSSPAMLPATLGQSPMEGLHASVLLKPFGLRPSGSGFFWFGPEKTNLFGAAAA